MKIFDMHIHTYGPEFDRDALLAEMGKAGVFGGCIFSPPPVEFNSKRGMPFRPRLDRILAIAKGYEERLLPVLWIHPDEEDVLEKVTRAAAEGIAAFKVICTDFYVYEDRCMKLWQAIADLNKPVFFHSGILWTGSPSSRYNRPVHWETLMDVKGLRFSMGHCSWPWTDECIALYGAFCYANRLKESSEMFFDLTPGTPPIYRKDLLTKLFTVDYGFDTTKNILFGTDCSAHHYRPDSTLRKLALDGSVMDELGISQEIREDIYCRNLMRFLGIGE
jgi:predicted TIM-barrel fold metal-dependent hydrolase